MVPAVFKPNMGRKSILSHTPTNAQQTYWPLEQEGVGPLDQVGVGPLEQVGVRSLNEQVGVGSLMYR